LTQRASEAQSARKEVPPNPRKVLLKDTKQKRDTKGRKKLTWWFKKKVRGYGGRSSERGNGENTRVGLRVSSFGIVKRMQ